MPVLKYDELRDVAVRLLLGLGASEADAECVATHLATADLRGVSTHGVRSIPMYADFVREGHIQPGASPRVARQSEATALVDGGNGFGQVVASFAAELAIEKSQEAGVGAVGVVRCNHVGALADYTIRIAERGLLGLMFANSAEIVAPAGGSSAQLGTNPLSFSAPRANAPPMALDMATSAATWGAVVLAADRGELLPEGVLFDAEGNPTTNPLEFMGPPVGAIQPLAGHKGYALALMIEILAGALTGTGCAGEMGWTPQGALILALDPEHFGGEESFTGHVERLVSRIKGSRLAPGADEILLPGEPEERAAHERRERGIPVEAETWEALGELATELDVVL